MAKSLQTSGREEYYVNVLIIKWRLKIGITFLMWQWISVAFVNELQRYEPASFSSREESACTFVR